MNRRTRHVMVAITAVAALTVTWVTAQGTIVGESRDPQKKEDTLPMITITLSRKTIKGVVAATDKTRRQGLLGWDRITDDVGMLLDFGTEGKHAIHMEGMKFPIDALWVDASGVIKLIYEEIRPNSGLTYPSMFPCTYCLELNAGFCKRFGVKTGQRVAFSDVRR